MATHITGVLRKTYEQLQGVPGLIGRAGALLLALLLIGAVAAADGLSVEITGPQDGAEVSGLVKVQVRARSEAAPVLAIEVAMGDLTATVDGGEGVVAFDAGELEPGFYEVLATAEDQAGNRGEARIQVDVVARHGLRIWMDCRPEEVAPGERFTVHAHLSSTDDVAGFQLVMTWDEAVLELADGAESVMRGAAVPDGAPPSIVNAETDGELTVLLIAPEADFAADESEILVVSMAVRGDAPAGEVQLRWGAAPGQILICDSRARLVEPGPERVDGSVTILPAQ